MSARPVVEATSVGSRNPHHNEVITNSAPSMMLDCGWSCIDEAATQRVMGRPVSMTQVSGSSSVPFGSWDR